MDTKTKKLLRRITELNQDNSLLKEELEECKRRGETWHDAYMETVNGAQVAAVIETTPGYLNVQVNATDGSFFFQADIPDDCDAVADWLKAVVLPQIPINRSHYRTGNEGEFSVRIWYRYGVEVSN